MLSNTTTTEIASASNGSPDIQALTERIRSASGFVDQLRHEVGKTVVGQRNMMDTLITGLLADGHVLLEGVPGLAKTLAIQTLSQAVAVDFSRIQFTPDLLPADVVGTMIYNQKQEQFTVSKGPIFAHFVLADEINRAPAKVQSALLEAMQERSVTAAGQNHKLPHPFFVLATQNPIEQEGTYPLPEAQLDRFMFNIWVDYPEYADELEVVKRTTGGDSASVNAVLSGDEIAAFQQHVRKMPVADNVIEYAVKLAAKTRPGREHAPDQVNQYLSWGAGPRASQYLIVAAKCHAAFAGKYSPDIENVRAVALPILRHRIVRNYKAEAEGITVEKLVDELI